MADNSLDDQRMQTFLIAHAGKCQTGFLGLQEDETLLFCFAMQLAWIDNRSFASASDG